MSETGNVVVVILTSFLCRGTNDVIRFLLGVSDRQTAKTDSIDDRWLPFGRMERASIKKIASFVYLVVHHRPRAFLAVLLT